MGSIGTDLHLYFDRSDMQWSLFYELNVLKHQPLCVATSRKLIAFEQADATTLGQHRLLSEYEPCVIISIISNCGLNWSNAELITKDVNSTLTSYSFADSPVQLCSSSESDEYMIYVERSNSAPKTKQRNVVNDVRKYHFIICIHQF